MKTYTTPSKSAIEKAKLTNVLILSQDYRTGELITVNGVLDTTKKNYKLYNGRTFGLHSDCWVNEDANLFNKLNGYGKSNQWFISFNKTIESYNKSTDTLTYAKD